MNMQVRARLRQRAQFISPGFATATFPAAAPLTTVWPGSRVLTDAIAKARSSVRRLIFAMTCSLTICSSLLDLPKELGSSPDHDFAATGVNVNSRTTAIHLLMEVTGGRAWSCDVVTIELKLTGIGRHVEFKLGCPRKFEANVS